MMPNGSYIADVAVLQSLASMDMTDKLLQWGATHAAAREAARDEGRQREAQALRERADRLHREILSDERPSHGRQD